MKPNSQPEKGSFLPRRSFRIFQARCALASTLAAARISSGKPANFGQEKKDDYTAHHYHQVLRTKFDPNWNLSGGGAGCRPLIRSWLSDCQRRQISGMETRERV